MHCPVMPEHHQVRFDRKTREIIKRDKALTGLWKYMRGCILEAKNSFGIYVMYVYHTLNHDFGVEVFIGKEGATINGLILKKGI